jgi:hypothetical protein
MMSAPTLADAVEALIARKVAVRGEPRQGEPVGDDAFARILVGLDLGVDDLREQSLRMARGMTSMAAGQRGLLLAEQVASLWADGVAVGLLLADMRARST